MFRTAKKLTFIFVLVVIGLMLISFLSYFLFDNVENMSLIYDSLSPHLIWFKYLVFIGLCLKYKSICKWIGYWYGNSKVADVLYESRFVLLICFVGMESLRYL